MNEEQEIKRALVVIEKIATLMNPEETDTAWTNVYMLAHAFAGDCGNPHADWKKHLDELEKNLKD